MTFNHIVSCKGPIATYSFNISFHFADTVQVRCPAPRSVVAPLSFVTNSRTQKMQTSKMRISRGLGGDDLSMAP